MRPRRVALMLRSVIGLLLAWVVALWIGNCAARDAAQRRVARSIGDALTADAAIAGADLALVRGRFSAHGLTVHRKGGQLRASARSLVAELAPLGWFFVDDELRGLTVTGVDLSLSGLDVLRTKASRRPVRTQAIDLRDATVEFSLTGVVPMIGRAKLTIASMHAGPTTLTTPLSWVFSCKSFDGTLTLPGGMSTRITYANGMLRAAGGFAGVTPIEMPFALPVKDAAREVEQLIDLGKQLMTKLPIDRAESWLDEWGGKLRRLLP